MQQDEDDIMTSKELAKVLKIHAVTVRLKAAAGQIPGRQIGNRWRFSRARINQWMQGTGDRTASK